MSGPSRLLPGLLRRRGLSSQALTSAWSGQERICNRFEETLGENQLLPVSQYLFNISGKSIRPRIITAMAGAANVQSWVNWAQVEKELDQRQELVCEMCEMYHTASLYHDDVIDNAGTRRGEPSVPAAWSTRHAVLGGDLVLAVAYKLLVEIDNDEVTRSMSTVVSDLVKGELLQMSGKVDLDTEEGLSLYTMKCYLKTASLLANGCRSVAHLASPSLADQAEEYGRELGIAFQIVDDILDFVCTPEQLGKPGGGADLVSGIRTAPLLLAARHSQKLSKMLSGESKLNPAEAIELVVRAGGVDEARILAMEHADKALAAITEWRDSEYKETLKMMVGTCVERNF